MRKEKIYISLIAIAFTLAIFLSVWFIFTVQKVELKVNSDSTDISKIYECLNKYKSKSMLIFKEDSVVLPVEDFPDYYVVSASKQFPNILKVEVCQRRPVFVINNNGEYDFLDKEGYFIKSTTENTFGRDVVEIKLKGLEIKQLTLGYKIETSYDDLLYSVFDMAVKIHLADCIKSVEIENGAMGISDAIFETYSGVSIKIEKVLDDGIEKIDRAFSAYDQAADDYQKTFDELLCYKTDDGEIKVAWSSSKNER